MPVHDWIREAGIFHDFHHKWISTLRRALNSGLLPPEYYALAEQQAAGFGPDVLTLQSPAHDGGEPTARSRGRGDPSGLLVAPPRSRFRAEANAEFYRRKKSTICIRHVTADDLVAVVEVISPGNKSGRAPFRALVDKACELLEYRIHLLLLDLFPPTKRDPNGIHAAIWEEITDEEFSLPPDKPLTLAA